MKKMYGDVPKEHIELAKELEQLEKDINDKPFPSETMAKMMVCLAHDWYQIGMEEEGNRLISKTEKICPDYAKCFLKRQMEEDPDFNYLMKSMLANLLFRMGSL